MNNLFKKLLLLVVFAIFSNINLNAQALVQLIHNSPDPAAASVDIYFNDVKYKDNIGFRQAGNFSTVSVMSNLIVKIADPTSTGPTDKILATFDMGSVEIGKGYVLMVNGVLGMNYEKGNADYDIYLNINKTNIGTPFQADNANAVEIFIGHGSTDAPLVNVYAENNTTPLVSNLAYNKVSNKLTLDPSSYVLNITPANDPASIVASYSAPLATAKGFKAFVFASGFLTPENEPDGKNNKFGLFVTLPDGSIIELPANTGDAFVQVVHNAADPVGAEVDVYVNGQLAPELDNFKFRTATPFLKIPAGIPIVVSINTPDSKSVSDGAINSYTLGALEKDTKYFLVANGVAGATFENPFERQINLNLFPKDAGLKSDLITDVQLFAYHGVTDAPAVDIYAYSETELGKDAIKKENRIVSNLDYADFSTAINVPASKYGISITPTNSPDVVVKTYKADLNIAGQQALVLASGFLSTDNEGVENAPAFGLIAVLENGAVALLEEYKANENAFVQVIHNSPDPAAAEVDIYVNDAKPEVLNNFKFRTATSFLELPSNEDIIVKIAAPSSENADDKIIATINLGKLEKSKRYYVTANGVVGTGFNIPEGREIGFNLKVNVLDDTEIKDGDIRLNVLHGSTDAPAVDIFANEYIKLVENIDYNNYSAFLDVKSDNYSIHLSPAGAEAKAARFIAPLELLRTSLAEQNIDLNQALVFASGFLNPTNQGISEELYDEYSFGLYAVIPEGAVVELFNFSKSSLVQIIHNSPDPILNSVDIYFNGEKLEETEDFTYLSSTGTLDVPAGVPINVSINAGDSENANDKVLKVFENVVFEQFKDYVVVANGVATPNFTNPFDRDITPTLSVKEIKMFAKNSNEFEFVTFHGVTDAPAVDIVVNDQIKAVENLDFREFSDGNSLPTGQYKVGIRAAGGDADVVAYDLNIPNAIVGQTGVVFASGFLTADDEGLENTSGRTFSVNVALNNGTVIPLPIITSVEDFVIDENIFSIYPNPTTDFINLNLNKIDINSINEVKIFDINGVNILNQTNNITNNIDVTSLNNGVYFIRIDSNEKSYIAKFNISK